MGRSAFLSVLAAALIACAPLGAGEAPSVRASAAFRPRVGGLFALSGDLKDVYDSFLHTEVGMKGTYRHLGVEVSLGLIAGEDSVLSTFTVLEDDTPTEVTRGVDVDARIGVVKLTATYELNPLAGVTGHEKEANVYAGGGFGFYPTEFKVGGPRPTLYGIAADESTYWGYGPHLVVGAEYFFSKVFGVFAEAQYSYLMFEPDKDGDDLDLHGVSAMAGFTLKF